MTNALPWTLLVVDDDEGLRHLVVRALTKAGWEARGLGTGSGAIEAAAGVARPFLILDQRLPDMDGNQVVAELKARGAAVPFLMMTGQGNERLAVEMMKLGASDYLVKDTELLDRLPGAVDRVLRGLETEWKLAETERALVTKAAELETLNLSLEHKVEARTAELVQKNQALSEALLQLEGAQDRLMEADRLKTASSLVSGVAHEINTPLGVALTAASMLQSLLDSLELPYGEDCLDAAVLKDFLGQGREATALLVRSLDRGVALVEAFKQLAVDQYSDDLEPFALGPHVHDALASLWLGDRVGPPVIEVAIPDTLVLTRASVAITQIVSHLVRNSLDHGYPPGQVGTLRLSAERAGNLLVLGYRDDGRGMDGATWSQAFTPFFTTNRSGGHLGLGLTIVGNLVRNQLGGTVELETSPGRGVRFTMTVPWTAVGE